MRPLYEPSATLEGGVGNEAPVRLDAGQTNGAHTMRGTKIDLVTESGVMDAYAFHPDGQGPWPATIFYMDGVGIRPQLFAMAERLASNGYYVLLPNLYYRAGSFAPFDPATVWESEPERARLMALVRSVDNQLAARDTGACLDFLRDQPETNDAKIGCVGYCLGGRVALSVAGTYPDRIAAAASIHGASLVTDHPGSPHRLIKEARAKLYVGAAEDDRSFTPADQDQLRASLEEAGASFAIEVYPGARHGFAVDGMPTYDREAAERHWQRVLTLFKETLS